MYEVHSYPCFLAEANEPPLNLRRVFLANSFILRNYSWKDNPLIQLLHMFHEKIKTNCKLNTNKLPLITAYALMKPILKHSYRTIKPHTFDRPWSFVTMAPLCDTTSGILLKDHLTPESCFREILSSDYEGYCPLYTYATLNLNLGLAAAAFYDEETRYIQGTPLQPFITILTAELYAIVSVVNYAVNGHRPHLLIITDSLSTPLNDSRIAYFKSTTHI